MKKSGCLIQQNEIYFSDTPKKTLDSEIKTPLVENQTLETDRFSIKIKRVDGVISELEIVHVEGDSIDLDFSYLE